MIALFDVELISDNTNDLLEFYHEYISDLIEFEVNENIKRTRGLTSLDSFREKYLVDDVLIYLVREGYKAKTCWGRIEGFNDNRIYVEMLEDPKHNFGYEEVSDEFYTHLDHSHYIDVLTVLRHSLVYIPCTQFLIKKMRTCFIK